MKTKTFKSGQQIHCEGEVNAGIYIVQSGKVRLSKTKGSDLIEIDELQKGDFLGLSAYCDNKNETSTATAIADTTLLEIPKEAVSGLKFETKSNVVLKMLQFLSSKLHVQNEKIRKLQYFDKLHFDQYQNTEISLYHLKDILKMSWILLLSFNRYNFAIKRDYFEDLCAILVSDFKIKPEKIIELYISSQVIIEDKKTGNLSLIDSNKLEFFSQFLLQHFIKNPRKLLLNKPSYDLLKKLIQLKGDSKIFWEDDFGFTHAYKHDLTGAFQEVSSASLILDRLSDKGFFKKEFDMTGQSFLSFEFYTIEEIIKCYDIIDNFGR